MRIPKKMIAIIAASTMAISFVGCSKSDDSADEQQQQIANLQKEVDALKVSLDESNKKVDDLEKLMPKKHLQLQHQSLI